MHPIPLSYFYFEDTEVAGIPKICYMICSCGKAKMPTGKPVIELEGAIYLTLLNTLEISPTSDQVWATAQTSRSGSSLPNMAASSHPRFGLSSDYFSDEKTRSRSWWAGKPCWTHDLSFHMPCFLADRRTQWVLKQPHSVSPCVWHLPLTTSHWSLSITKLLP